MTEQGKRPGGLTALAVLNFVFGGLGVLGILAMYALLAAADSISGGEVTAAMAKTPGAALVWVGLLLGLVGTVLLIVSGVGYLGLKKMLGRTIGNAYAAISIISGIFSLAALGQGFGLSTIIGLVYPVLTLILLNTTFKDDFVN